MPENYIDILIAYGEALVTRFRDYWLPLPVLWTLIICLLVLALLMVSVNYARVSSAMRRGFAVALIASVLNLLLIGGAYLYIIHPADALVMGSFERYVGTGVIAVLVFMLYLWVYSFEYIRSSLKWLFQAIGLVAMGAVIIAAIPMLVEDIVENHDDRTQEGAHLWAHTALTENVDVNNDKVFIVIQVYYRWQYDKMQYFLAPLQINRPRFAPHDANALPSPEDPLFIMNRDPEEWAKELVKQEYDYVYLAYINDAFAEIYQSLFEDVSTIHDKALYKVVTLPDGRVVLRLMYVQIHPWEQDWYY